MSSPIPKALVTPAEYLAIERNIETRHEYYHGEMFAMGGASREHNLMVFNLASTLGHQLKGRDCEAYMNDMRVTVSASGLYTYPDVVVTCTEPRFEDDQLDTLLNPQVIIEVLSDSTETYDRGRKFGHYRQIESLREYLLVSQKRPHIEHYALQPAGGWLLTEATEMAGEMALPSIGCTLKLADVYAKIQFDEA